MLIAIKLVLLATPGINWKYFWMQLNQQEHSKLKYCRYINKESTYKRVLRYWLKLVFPSADSRDHRESKIIYVVVKSEV